MCANSWHLRCDDKRRRCLQRIILDGGRLSSGRYNSFGSKERWKVGAQSLQAKHALQQVSVHVMYIIDHMSRVCRTPGVVIYHPGGGVVFINKLIAGSPRVANAQPEILHLCRISVLPNTKIQTWRARVNNSSNLRQHCI